jgi:hypothetical protein
MIKKTRQLQNELIDFALPRGNKNNNSNTNNSSFAFCDNNSSRRNNLACLSMEDNYLNDDDDDDEPVFLSHKKSASSAKPEPKYPPQNSENPSSCEVIKSEVPCENFSYIKPGKKLRTKCNWFKQRTPKCKETKRNERNDAIDALLTQLRGRSDQDIEIYVNNPNSDIYRHWHAGPRELLNRVLSLKYTHGPGPLARNGGNKTRKGQRKGGNKTRKGQRNGGNKTRRKQNK